MALPRHQTLRQKASLAMRSGDPLAALRIYEELERLEPDDPTWPERRAGACHELGRREEELLCLRRSLALLIDQGQVLPAIATCKLILDVVPDDPDALDRLHLLYAEPAAPTDRDRAPEVPLVLPADQDAPLAELELTEVIPEARAVRFGEGGGVAEIPLDDRSADFVHTDVDPSGAADRPGPVDAGRAAGPGRATTAEAAARRRPTEVEVDFVDEVRASPDAAEARGGRSGGSRSADAPAARASARDAAVGAAAGAELGRTPLFGSLDVTTLHHLVSRVDVVRLSAGETLFRQGDPANALYVVVDGAVVPIAEGPTRTRMAVLETGAFFGEIGLVTNQPRNATIEALVDTRLIAIDRKVMWSLIRERGDVSRTLLGFLRERTIDRCERTHPLFAPFRRAAIGSLASRFRFLEVQDAAAVVEQGLPSEGLFVLLAGAMDVVDEDADKDLDRLGPGDVFGAVSLVRGTPAAASVFAVGKCWVLVLESSRLRRLLAGRPSLEDALGAVLDRGDGTAIV